MFSVLPAISCEAAYVQHDCELPATCLSPSHVHAAVLPARMISWPPPPTPNRELVARHEPHEPVAYIGVRGVKVAASKQATSSMTIETERVLVHRGYDGPSTRIPLLGLGLWLANDAECEKAVGLALENGYRHIDTANLYANEKAVGNAVRASGIPREEIFITTKLWNTDHGYKNTLRAFDKSLKELGLDYVDLYLIHSPLSPSRLDSWKAMEEILLSGKVKAIGVSNYGIKHLEELFGQCRIRPSVNQVELTPFCTREKLVEFCKKENIVLEAYSPLTRGKKLNHPTLVKLAKDYNKSPAQLLIRWCIQKDFVPLPKSVTPSRIVENAQVFDFEISQKDMAKLDSLNENFNVSWDPTTSN